MSSTKDTVSVSPARAHNLNVDLIRVCACFFVISVHFFLNNGFYNQPIDGPRMFVMLLAGNFFLMCVPLFMLLTGFLSGHFAPNAKHLLRIVHVGLIYLLCTLVCLVFRTFDAGYAFTVKNAIMDFISFSGAPYAWYIEMHLGMMLMIPFLNAAYRNLSRPAKRILLGSCLVLTCASTTIPAFGLFDYWAGLYPITYYFIGAYLAEFRPVVRKRYAVPALAAVTILVTAINYSFDHGRPFSWFSYIGYGSTYVLAMSVLFFLLILQLPLDKLPNALTRLIQWAARHTLPAYLLSYCFDALIYPRLNSAIPLATDKIFHYLIVVPVVFVCSLLSGSVVTLVTGWLFRPIRQVVEKLSHRQTTPAAM